MEDSHGYGWEGLAPVPIPQAYLWGGRRAEQTVQHSYSDYYKETEFAVQYRILYCHALYLSLLSSLPLQSTETEILLQLFFGLCI